MVKWPAIPTCPPIRQCLPILVDPATPVCAAIAVCAPISTLWAICIWLSSFTPFLIIVDPSVALSIVVPAPTSTKSSIITLPVWGTFWYSPFSFGVNPNPSAPTIAPLWITQWSPIIDSE